MAQIIDGKAVSQHLRGEIAKEVETLRKETGAAPGLAVILVGDDPASAVYVRNKRRACEETGIRSSVFELPGETPENELLALLEKLNKDDTVDGILVQLPLPRHISEDKVIAAIDPAKDVDAFHTENVGKIMLGKYDFLPCTPAGVMELLRYYNIPVAGKDCVVVGRSNIVGKPQAMLLLAQNGTVTICHSRTENLADKTKNADILVVAVGRPNFITGEMIKPGATVIDVGINRGADGKLCGDVHFESAERVAGAITPVPGGVGPMTITMLLKNTVKAASCKREKTGKI